jgi:hypothetical protein
MAYSWACEMFKNYIWRHYSRAEVGNLFLKVATGVTNEKCNSPHHVKTKNLG